MTLQSQYARPRTTMKAATSNTGGLLLQLPRNTSPLTAFLIRPERHNILDCWFIRHQSFDVWPAQPHACDPLGIRTADKRRPIRLAHRRRD